jgi:hypothetical protein
MVLVYYINICLILIFIYILFTITFIKIDIIYENMNEFLKFDILTTNENILYFLLQITIIIIIYKIFKYSSTE